MSKHQKELPKTKEEAIKEAKEYYDNAKETLKKSEIVNGRYKNAKYVKEASAMGYLSALRAIDSYLLSKQISPEKLPASIQEYFKALTKIPHNGKLIDVLNDVYDCLHLCGYYRGVVSEAVIKDGFKKAKEIIDTFSKHRNLNKSN